MRVNEGAERYEKACRGGYALIHTKMRGDDKNWLLVKEADKEADARRKPVTTEPKSVISGKTVIEMGKLTDT